MSLKKRNIRLLNILGVLILTSLVLYFIPEDDKSSIDNIALFQISDTASIDKITIQSKALNNSLVKTDTGWIINNKMKADENIMMVLLSVIKQVEILRPIPESQEAEIAPAFNEDAIEVKFYSNDNLQESFRAGSNETKTISIFRTDEGNYLVVNLPGYDSFVSGIFEISEIDWKDRLIVDVTPTSLKQMHVEYFDEAEKSFIVEVAGNLPLIPGVEDLDTLALMDYLDQFQYFQADRYADLTKDTRYDSLSKTQPYVKFSFANLTQNASITFFPKLPNDPEILGVTDEGELALFNHKRISGIFRPKDFFRKGR